MIVQNRDLAMISGLEDRHPVGGFAWELSIPQQGCILSEAVQQGLCPLPAESAVAGRGTFWERVVQLRFG